MTDEVEQRRLEVLVEHLRSEVDHGWDACIATFDGHPRDEIVRTGAGVRRRGGGARPSPAPARGVPDQRHEHARFHGASDDPVVAELDLVGTNTGPLVGQPPTGRAFRVSTIAVFTVAGDRITHERVYLTSPDVLADRPARPARRPLSRVRGRVRRRGAR